MKDLNRYFEILEVSPTATKEEIKKAYHDLTWVWHPDRFPNNSSLLKKAEEKTKEINDAYKTLISITFTSSKASDGDTASSHSAYKEPSYTSPKYSNQKSTDIQGIKLISIPGGCFSMGSNFEDDVQNRERGHGFFKNEKPVHIVTVFSFEMGIYEVTQGQYQSVIGTNPVNDNLDDYANSDDVGENIPVNYVNWWDAIMFCNKLSDAAELNLCYNEKSGACDFSKNGFRLPTEAEWEYACRAGTTTHFYTGNNFYYRHDEDSLIFSISTDLDRAGWYEDNCSNTYVDTNTAYHNVGEKEKNLFGLFDMHGNCEEWCNDWYSESYYYLSPSNNPTGPPSGDNRVTRGGSKCEEALECRSANRGSCDPTFRDSDIGFRVVRRH